MSDQHVSPTPEHFLTLIRQQQRGRLKIYLGFAAGVGKTCAMLQEGQRLKRLGVDVVIGFLETHGRPDTEAQVGDLEQLPRRQIEYRGVVLEEMDIDALLVRRPAVALVDELAHSNSPGSRNAKRYQDVELLLHAGINVVSTLNIQHLESLYDLVEKATGVKVKERVPDYIIGIADQLVNVDLSAEDLRDRLLAGKVYPKQRINQALENFFTQANLTRLREFALEEVAHRLDRRRSHLEKVPAPNTATRIMVCLSSRGPNAAHLLRKGARIADRLSASWYSVYIQTPSEDLTRIEASVQRQISNTLELVQQLGGTPMTFKGSDVAATVAAFAREYGITHIILGRSLQPWYHRLLERSVLERLLRELPHVDILVAGVE